MTILLDFESRSLADLPTIGGRNYWADPSSEVLCCVAYDTTEREWTAWIPGDPRPQWADYGEPLAAHNMSGFDRFALEKLNWIYADTPLIDTADLARRAGLPGALDALGTRWLGRAKDKAGSAFTKALSRVSRAKATRGRLPPITPEVIERVVTYCASDVEILEHGWPLLSPWLVLEPDVLRVDRAINDRGIQFDVELARRLLECCDKLTDDALAEAGSALGLAPERVREIANSPAQFCAFTYLTDATKETVDAVLSRPHEGHSKRAVAMCRARRAMASIARGKLEAGLARVSPDGRLRDSMRYYGAHTGRWSHKGLQPGNMPRPAKRFDGWGEAEIDALAAAVLAGEWPDGDEIDLLLRACLRARPGHTLIVRDFSGVEARCLAWAAGDQAALDVFASGVSPYKVAAAGIFGGSPEDYSKGDPLYTAGKVAELACGYQGGAGALERMAHAYGFDFSSAPITPAEIVARWRELHAPIKRFWYEVQAAFIAAANGHESTVSCFTFQPSADGSAVAIFLPSGRPVVYNDVQIGRDDKGRPRASYHGTKGREHTYGGKLVENITQALCRDLLAEALVAAEDAGLAPVLHVHDEAVCEVPSSAVREAEECLHVIMTDVPEYVEGFPLDAAGHTGERYRK